MKVTISEANRKAQQLKLEYTRILNEEKSVKTYAHGEGEQPIIQDYDFNGTQNRLRVLNDRIAWIRHAVNQFNVSTKVQGLNITVDEALVRISMLSGMKKRLDEMLLIPEVTRENNYRAVEIVHRNFDPAEVQAEADEVTDELNRLRAALDLTNLTSTIDIDSD